MDCPHKEVVGKNTSTEASEIVACFAAVFRLGSSLPRDEMQSKGEGRDEPSLKTTAKEVSDMAAAVPLSFSQFHLYEQEELAKRWKKWLSRCRNFLILYGCHR